MTPSSLRHAAQIRALQSLIGSELSLQRHFRQLLDAIEDASIFVKTVDGVLVFGNKSLVRRLGLQNETELLGLTDRDLHPPHLAEKYRQDDQDVIRSGREKLNLIEMFKGEHGLLQWFITHKYPVFDRNGQVIGIMGCLQECRKLNDAVSAGDQGILAASEYIQRNYRNRIAVEQLSQLGNMPVRQFQRKFKEIFAASPREYIIRHRIRHACEALRNTRKGIAKICAEAGFYDQSSFTRQFKKYMKVTPLRYRREG